MSEFKEVGIVECPKCGLSSLSWNISCARCGADLMPDDNNGADDPHIHARHTQENAA